MARPYNHLAVRHEDEDVEPQTDHVEVEKQLRRLKQSAEPRDNEPMPTERAKTAWPPHNPQSPTERMAVQLQAEYAAGDASRSTVKYPGSFPAIDRNGFLIAPDMTDSAKDSMAPDFASPPSNRSGRFVNWDASPRLLNWR